MATTKTPEPLDGDGCLIDLSEPVMEEATKYAHALGMNFYEFVCAALEDKLVHLRRDAQLGNAVSRSVWKPLLK